MPSAIDQSYSQQFFTLQAKHIFLVMQWQVKILLHSVVVSLTNLSHQDVSLLARQVLLT